MQVTHITKKEELVAYLNQLNVAVLSTASSNGTPHSAVIYFIVDHDLNFYFLTLSNTRKAKNLRENSKASFTTIDLPTMITVQTSGEVKEVTDNQQYTLLVKELGDVNARKNSPHWPPPISNLENAGSVTVFKFRPDWLRVGNYGEGKYMLEKEKQDKNVFVEIIPEQKS